MGLQMIVGQENKMLTNKNIFCRFLVRGHGLPLYRTQSRGGQSSGDPCAIVVMCDCVMPVYEFSSNRSTWGP